MVNELPESRIALALILGVSLSLVGCSSNLDTDAATAANNKTNIQRLTNLYFAFQMKNDFIGPTDEAEFRSFIEKYPTKKLERIGVDANSLDQLFINERDGEPFKIRFEVQGSLMGSSEPVVFESVGVGGKKTRWLPGHDSTGSRRGRIQRFMAW